MHVVVNPASSCVVPAQIHTPDSSRYWIGTTYEARHAAGQEPENIDKVRSYYGLNVLHASAGQHKYFLFVIFFVTVSLDSGARCDVLMPDAYVCVKRVQHVALDGLD